MHLEWFWVGIWVHIADFAINFSAINVFNSVDLDFIIRSFVQVSLIWMNTEMRISDFWAFTLWNLYDSPTNFFDISQFTTNFLNLVNIYVDFVDFQAFGLLKWCSWFNLISESALQIFWFLPSAIRWKFLDLSE